MFRHTRATTVVSHPAQVLDLAGVGPAQPEPGLLDGVLGLAQGANHPVGHRAEVRLVLLEAPRQSFAFVHRPYSLPRVITHDH
jgi:hypothetical protein